MGQKRKNSLVLLAFEKQLTQSIDLDDFLVTRHVACNCNKIKLQTLCIFPRHVAVDVSAPIDRGVG